MVVHRITPRLVDYPFDPAKARVRVYATQSTHKTLTSLRQGSMIHVFDQDFEQKVSEAFHEAYMAHTSTSPNYQILASLDLGRRQVALEGVELVQRQIENAMQLRDAIDNHPLLNRYMACLRTSDLIPDEFRPSGIEQPLRSGLRNMMADWDADEFVLDPSRITLSIGRTGYDGDTFKREQLMDRGYRECLAALQTGQVDFSNDAKDAGDVGAGHTVTALYEIVPNGGTNGELAKLDGIVAAASDPASPMTATR